MTKLLCGVRDDKIQKITDSNRLNPKLVYNFYIYFFLVEANFRISLQNSFTINIAYVYSFVVKMFACFCRSVVAC